MFKLVTMIANFVYFYHLINGTTNMRSHFDEISDNKREIFDKIKILKSVIFFHLVIYLFS
jgi:hypothetical protein